MVGFAGSPYSSGKKNSSTTHNKVTVMKGKMEELKEVLDIGQAYDNAKEALKTNLSKESKDTTSWRLQFWKDGIPMGGQDQTNTGYKNALKTAKRIKETTPSLDSVQIIRTYKQRRK